MKKIKAWYFSTAKKTLGYCDGREITIGTTHEVKCIPVCCEIGLHGSVDIFDALRYASGPVIWRVEIWGNVDRRNDKICGTHRKYLTGGIDISEILRQFSRECVFDVVHLWDAAEIVIEYLKTVNEDIRDAAWAAARNAAWAAARDAAWAAARDAALDAARAAAWAAARAAARDAAWAAARDAAWDAARAKQSKRLEELVLEAIGR